MKRLLIVSDTCANQINGVTRLLTLMEDNIHRYVGWDVHIVTADNFPSCPYPGYPNIRLACAHAARIDNMLDHVRPDYVHILTEALVGRGFRYVCKRRDIRFTSHYCTNVPEVLKNYIYAPRIVSHAYLQHFHKPSALTLVQSRGMEKFLHQQGVAPTLLVLPGIDDLPFQQDVPPPLVYQGIKKPVLLCVSRLSPEKNVEDFCKLPAELGTKVLIGDGPLRDRLERQYPDTYFLGEISSDRIAPFYKHASCFVFPSTKDTFGLVLLEALAAGIPIAAYQSSMGAQDIKEKPNVVLHHDLTQAVILARKIPKSQNSVDPYFSIKSYVTRFTDAICFSQIKQFQSEPSYQPLRLG